jgi:hypothetical protein
MIIASLFTEISTAFAEAAALAGVSISPTDIEVQFTAAPHTPPSSLPSGKLAVYVFMFGNRCLKVGKAGPKSAARFCSQHYGVNRAPSTLAKSILKNQKTLGIIDISNENVEAWILSHTSRANFLVSSSYDPFVLSLLEAFVQCRLKPEFEGFASQRIGESTHALDEI